MMVGSDPHLAADGAGLAVSERLRLVLGLLGAVLVFLGIELMHCLNDMAPLAGPAPRLLADVFPNPGWVLAGTLCSLLGCALAFSYLPNLGREERQAPKMSPEDGAVTAAWSRDRRLVPRLVAALVATGLYAPVLASALHHDAGTLTLVALILSTVLYGVAFGGVRWDIAGCVRWLARLSLGDVLIPLVVLVAFVAVNTRDLHHWLYAFWGDEWAFYTTAKSLALGGQLDLLSQAGVYGIHPLAGSGYEALVMRLFGLNVFGWRLSSILAAGLPVLPLYWLGKQLGGGLAAAAACVLYAACSVLWAYCHIGYNEHEPLLAIIPAAALLYTGLRNGRAVPLFAAGACAGAGWYTLFTARPMIGVLVLVALTEWQGGGRATLRRILLILCGFAVVVLPLAIDNGLDTIRQMFPLISVSQACTNIPFPTLLAQNSVRALYQFLYATESDHYVVGELFDVVSAVGLCLGLVLALRRLRRLAVRLVAIWFVVTLCLTTPLYYAPQVADTRAQIVIPAAALLAGAGLAALSQTVSLALLGRAHRLVATTVLATVLVMAVVLNGYRFYVTMPRQLQVSPIAMTLGALQAAPDSTAVLAGALSDANLCQVLDGFEIDSRTVLRFQGQQLVTQCPSPQTGFAVRQSVRVILNDQARAVMARCGVRPERVLLAPNGQALWGIRFRVSAVAPAPSAGDVSRRIMGLCRPLAGLRPS